MSLVFADRPIEIIPPGTLSPANVEYRVGVGRRDFDHIWRAAPMIRASWNGAVLAEAEETQIVEGNHYFPPDTVDHSFLESSATRTVCPWKGQATYYTVNVNREPNVDAAWTYLDPKPEAAHIKDHIAFWKGVQIEVG